MDRGHASKAEIYAGGFRVDEEIRRACDIEVDDETVRDVQRALTRARSQVADYFQTTLAGQEGPGFLRYAAGGHYRVHRDISPDWVTDFPRRISLVLFLTTADGSSVPGSGDGGALRLHASDGDEIEIPPVAGTLVAFWSTVPHEVLPVRAGIRDAVVDWFY